MGGGGHHLHSCGDQRPRAHARHTWGCSGATRRLLFSLLTEEDLGGISSWADRLITCLHWTLYWQKSHLP